jgi:hypothetical protein
VVEDLGGGFDDGAQRLGVAAKVGDQDLDLAVGEAPADGADGGGEEKMEAPPSDNSSRLTEVTTAYFRPIFSAASATRSGSSVSRPSGRPWGTAQKPQARVQRLPRIMKVAVRWPQHSATLGQRADSHTVCRPFWRMMRLRSV